MKLGIALTLGVISCLASARAAGQSFGMTLQPSSELPLFGDPKGSGVGVLTLSGKTISYTFSSRVFSNQRPATSIREANSQRDPS